MGRFIKILDENYKFWQEMDCPPESKMEYAGSVIFDFTTYDSLVDSTFATLMLEVVGCILNRTATKYMNNEDCYLNYLIMVNMPFLTDKLEWGGSIRGAWFNDYQEYEIDCGRIEIKEKELTVFIADLIEWCSDEEKIK